MSKPLSPVICTLLALTVALLGYFLTDPVGYCSSEDRKLQDLEFQRATFNILKMQRQLVLSVKQLGGATRYNIRPYDERYWKWNKSFDANNCCDVERNASFIRRVLKLQEVVVRVNPYAPEWYDDWLTFRYDVCGNLKSSDAGVPSAQLHDVKTTNKDLQDDSGSF